ncbi:MAG: hypothetical protein HC778_05105, partial [Chamaesiphon sp. CSU_1_12]|nr:hypothetical protein [Chamaesiphon sp. CSU_1_12]
MFDFLPASFLHRLFFGFGGFFLFTVSLLVLRAVWALGNGEAAWNRVQASFQNPIYVLFHAIAFLWLSWFILRGRARCCGRPYSFRYVFVELLTAGLFLACALQFSPAKALLGMVFLACLVCATFIDLDHMIIPDPFTIWLAVLGVGASFAFPALHGVEADMPLLAHLRSGG